MTCLRGLAVAAVALICLGLPRAGAQDLGIIRSEILVLDPERLFEQTELGQRMVADHQAEREKLASRNRRLEAELEAEEKRLTELRAETSPEEFRDMADAFDAKVQEIRRDSERRVVDLERDRERLPIQFLRAVEPVLSEVMREAGGTVVLDARTVLFRTDAVDVTETAIARIDRAIGDNLPESEGNTGTDPAPSDPGTDTGTDPATGDSE
ncbi:OmpH family outer membrane protein [Roseovarius sp.]|uniref:OmpH family outer membrane protein n=1 Tax=Roseovarius sp. TaxID=1486281 RepID=UPI00261A3C03|nr:OmpH family outer membrane protein [Roseovarius sp.]MDM8167824.1 OmpH family outer membrane protein [Roseovarius sp.]